MLFMYLLDNAHVSDKATVLDFGCGCGSAAIATTMNGAHSVLANDIDRYALLSTQLNFRLNKLPYEKLIFRDTNFLLPQNFDIVVEYLKQSPKRVIILGDMFYDSDFAVVVFDWLKRLKNASGARILVGDPDRHPLAEKKYVESYPTKFSKILLHEYPLPGYVTREHYGFTSAKVFEIEF